MDAATVNTYDTRAAEFAARYTSAELEGGA